MLNPTHFIEVYNPTKDYKFEGVRHTNQTNCLCVRYLDKQLKITTDTKCFKTIAIFKIKLKK